MRELGPTQLYAAARRFLGARPAASPPLTPALVLRAAAREMRRARDLPVEIEGEAGRAGCESGGGRGAADEAIAELCRDLPGFAELLRRDDALGRLCQALNEPALAAAYRATVGGRKFEPAELPAVTQLFTPDWVVRFLLDNTLGRLWLESHPDSRLGTKLPWLVQLPAGPRDDATRSTAGAAPRLARDFKVLDPACGTMNFGLAAADLLLAMYREEQERAGRPGWPAEPSVRCDGEVPAAILRHNLFGTDIDPLALDLARQVLGMKFRRTIRSGDCNLLRADWLLDESRPDWPRWFDVIATNPPYLSARNLPAEHVRKMKALFPCAWRDACACFLDKALDLLPPGGRAGFLSIQSLLFTGSYAALRSAVTDRSALEILAHFGPGLFGVGNPGTLQTAALVLRREQGPLLRRRQEAVAFRLVAHPGADEKRQALREAIREVSRPPATADFSGPSSPTPTIFRLSQSDLTALPRGTWAYWVTAAERTAFATLPRLAQVAAPRQGLATTDNARFVRYWWEVEPMGVEPLAAATPGRWVPYVKGGRFRRWYEAPGYRLNWEDDGREIKQAIVERYPYLQGKWQWVAKNAGYYGRPGVTWSYLTSGAFSARRLEPGCVFDVAGSSLFPADERQGLALLASLNSSAASRLLGLINPTVNFQVGDLAQLPVPPAAPEELVRKVAAAIDLQREFDRFDETSPDFRAPLPWEGADDVWRSMRRRLRALEREIDAQVADLYGLPAPSPSCDDRRAAGESGPEGPGVDVYEEAKRSDVFDRPEWARRWIGFAVGLELGRWGVGRSPPPFLRLRPPDPAMLGRLRDHLAARAGPAAADEVPAAVGGLDRFLCRDFFPWHVLRYRRRPVYWLLGDSTTAHLLRHDRATADAVRSALRPCGAAPPASWRRHVDDGIPFNLAPLAAWVPEPRFRKELAKIAVRLDGGDRSWSMTARDLVAPTGVVSAADTSNKTPARTKRRIALF